MIPNICKPDDKECIAREKMHPANKFIDRLSRKMTIKGCRVSLSEQNDALSSIHTLGGVDNLESIGDVKTILMASLSKSDSCDTIFNKSWNELLIPRKEVFGGNRGLDDLSIPSGMRPLIEKHIGNLIQNSAEVEGMVVNEKEMEELLKQGKIEAGEGIGMPSDVQDLMNKCTQAMQGKGKGGIGQCLSDINSRIKDMINESFKSRKLSKVRNIGSEAENIVDSLTKQINKETNISNEDAAKLKRFLNDLKEFKKFLRKTMDSEIPQMDISPQFDDPSAEQRFIDKFMKGAIDSWGAPGFVGTITQSDYFKSKVREGLKSLKTRQGKNERYRERGKNIAARYTIRQGMRKGLLLDTFYKSKPPKQKEDIIWLADTSGCFIGSTLLLTPLGLKEIRDINKGDYVLSSDLKKLSFNKVTKKFKYKKKVLLQIKTKTGTQLDVTPNHSFFVVKISKKERKDISRNNKYTKRAISNLKITEKLACELKEGDYILTFKNLDYNKNIKLPSYTPKGNHILTSEEIEIIKKLHNAGISKVAIKKKSGIGRSKIDMVLAGVNKHPVKLNINEEFMQLLGYITADGNTSVSIKSSSMYTVVTDKSLANLKRYQEIAKNMGINALIRKRDKQRLYFNSKYFTGYLLNIFPEIVKRSPKRSIPSFVTKCNNKLLAAYIKGFYDGEGTIGDHGVDFTNTSKVLMNQLKLSLKRLSINSTLYSFIVPERRINGGKIIKETLFHRLVIYGKSEIRKFNKVIGVTRPDKIDKLNNLKQDLFRNQNRRMIDYTTQLCLEKIKYINKYEVKGIDVYDLEVENNHNYFANGILAHNSMGSTFSFIQPIVDTMDGLGIKQKFFLGTEEGKEVKPNSNFKDTLESLGTSGTQLSKAYDDIKPKVGSWRKKTFIVYSDMQDAVPEEFEKRLSQVVADGGKVLLLNRTKNNGWDKKYVDAVVGKEPIVEFEDVDDFDRLVAVLKEAAPIIKK